jgi:hypothetical protein
MRISLTLQGTSKSKTKIETFDLDWFDLTENEFNDFNYQEKKRALQDYINDYEPENNWKIKSFKIV